MSVRRNNPDSETAILSPLIEFLEICSNQGKLRYFRAHPVRLVSKGGKTFPARIRASQRGAPDIFVFLQNDAVWIEAKSLKGKRRAEQESWFSWFSKQSDIYMYWMPKSHGDVNAIIKWIRDRI